MVQPIIDSLAQQPSAKPAGAPSNPPASDEGPPPAAKAAPEGIPANRRLFTLLNLKTRIARKTLIMMYFVRIR